VKKCDLRSVLKDSEELGRAVQNTRKRLRIDRKDTAFYKGDKNMEGKLYDDILRYSGLWTGGEKIDRI